MRLQPPRPDGTPPQCLRRAGLLRWNMAWEDMGDTCTGPVAGDPDLLVGQAAAWSEEANVYAPKYRQMGFAAQGMDLETTDKHLDNVKVSTAKLTLPVPRQDAAQERFHVHPPSA